MPAASFVCTLLQTTYCLHERREDDLPVTHHTIARLTKNVRFGVFVDGYNALRSRASSHVLTGPRDAHGNVQVWGNGLACQAHLPVAWHPSCIHSRARRPHGGAKHPCQFLQLTKWLWTS